MQGRFATYIKGARISSLDNKHKLWNEEELKEYKRLQNLM